MSIGQSSHLFIGLFDRGIIVSRPTLGNLLLAFRDPETLFVCFHPPAGPSSAYGMISRPWVSVERARGSTQHTSLRTGHGFALRLAVPFDSHFSYLSMPGLSNSNKRRDGLSRGKDPLPAAWDTVLLAWVEHAASCRLAYLPASGLHFEEKRPRSYPCRTGAFDSHSQLD